MQVAGVVGEPPDPGLGLVAPADPPLGERLEQDLGPGPAVVARPGADRVDRVVEGVGVSQRGDLGQRLDPQLLVAVALHAGEQEAAAELLGLVVLEHRLGPAPAGGVDPGAGERGPDVLLGVVEVLDRDPPELALEHAQAPVRIVGDRDDALLDPDPAAAATAHRADHDRAAAVDVAVEQAVQGDDRLVVGGGRVDEVDHQAGLLARVAAGDAADALLVDATRGGRREVHADRRAGRVPALGEQHRVAEHVDLASLEPGEDLGQLALRRLAGDGAGVDPGVLEGLGDVGRVLDAGGVDDARHAAEARAVEVGDRDVERRLVEQLGQLLLVEVLVHLALAQRHLGDRPHPGPRRDPDAAQRRDHAAAGGLGEVEAGGLGGEEVGDVAGDQRAGRGHADEDRARPGADAGAGLLAQRGVGLVADHDRVGIGDAAGVADEPLVGLDGDRAVGMVGAVEQGRREPVGVAAVGDLADELVDQVAAVGEDQDAARPRGLDEADRGDGLAGAGGVLEPEAAVGARVLGRLLDDVLVLLAPPVLGLLVLGCLVFLLFEGRVPAVGLGAVLRLRLLDGGSSRRLGRCRSPSTGAR